MPTVYSALLDGISKPRNVKVRETVYNTLARSHLEYASAVWDSHTEVRTSQIEQVQRRTARWIVSNYDWQASVTQIVQDLGWGTLEQRERMPVFVSSIKLFMGWLPYPSRTIYSTVTESLDSHSMTFRQVSPSRDYYKYSFFPSQ